MAKQITKPNDPVKILAHEDLTQMESVLQVINKTIELANKVADTYETLNIGPFTYDLYEDLTENGVMNARVAYRTSTTNEIKRLMINNPSIQNAILKDIDNAINPLDDAIKALKKYSLNRIGYYSLLKRSAKASFENGRFVLTHDNIETIKDEYCRIYIEDSKQEEALNALQNLVDAYNNLIKKIKPMNPEIANRFSQSSLPLSDFMALKNQEASVYKPALEYFLVTA